MPPGEGDEVMMKTLTLTAAVPYDIVIGEGILADSGDAVKELFGL